MCNNLRKHLITVFVWLALSPHIMTAKLMIYIWIIRTSIYPGIASLCYELCIFLPSDSQIFYLIFINLLRRYILVSTPSHVFRSSEVCCTALQAPLYSLVWAWAHAAKTSFCIRLRTRKSKRKQVSILYCTYLQGANQLARYNPTN